MGGYAYSAKVPTTPPRTTPEGWPLNWLVPDGDGPWPPGWPIEADGLTLTVSIPATITIGASATVECRVKQDALDTPDFEAHVLKVVALRGSVTCQMRLDTGDPWADELFIQVGNYTGSQYGFSDTIYFNTDAGDDGSTLLVQCLMISVDPVVQGIGYSIIGTATTNIYLATTAEDVYRYTILTNVSALVLPTGGLLSSLEDNTSAGAGLLPMITNSTGFGTYDASANVLTVRTASGLSYQGKLYCGIPTGVIDTYGYDGGSSDNYGCEEFTDATSTWANRADAASPPRHDGHAAHCNGNVFMYSGVSLTGSPNTRKILNLALDLDSWTVLTQYLSVPSSTLSTAVSDEINVYCMGSSGYSAMYDYGTNAYTTLVNVPSSFANATHYAGKMYFSGTTGRIYNIPTAAYSVGLIQTGAASIAALTV